MRGACEYEQESFIFFPSIGCQIGMNHKYTFHVCLHCTRILQNHLMERTLSFEHMFDTSIITRLNSCLSSEYMFNHKETEFKSPSLTRIN